MSVYILYRPFYARTFGFFPPPRKNWGYGWTGKNIGKYQNFHNKWSYSIHDFLVNSMMWKNYSCLCLVQGFESWILWTQWSKKQKGRFKSDTWTCKPKQSVLNKDNSVFGWNSSSKQSSTRFVVAICGKWTNYVDRCNYRKSELHDKQRFAFSL